MAPKKRGRRAADTKVKTPLTDITELLRADSAVLGKRAAVVAAGAGLALSATLPTAEDASDIEAQASTDAAHSDEGFTAQSKVVVDSGSKSLAGTAKASSFSAHKAPSTAGGTTRLVSTATGDIGSDDPISETTGPKGARVVAIAKSYVGTPYRWGGTTPSGWDCSGFTSYVYRQVGISLPHSSSGQHSRGTVVSRSAAQPGDLMWHPGHVGIYAGNGMMVDARGKKYGTVYTSASWMRNAVFIRLW